MNLITTHENDIILERVKRFEPNSWIAKYDGIRIVTQTRYGLKDSWPTERGLKTAMHWFFDYLDLNGCGPDLARAIDLEPNMSHEFNTKKLIEILIAEKHLTIEQLC